MKRTVTPALAASLAIAATLAAPAARADDLVCHSTVINPVATNETPVLTTIQCDRPSHALPALRWTTTVASGAAVAVGVVFEIMAANDRAELASYTAQRDANTGLPLVRYSDVAALDQRRAQDEALGAGFLIAGAVVGLGSLALWLVPDHGRAGHAAARVRERVAVGVSPSAMVLRLAF